MNSISIDIDLDDAEDVVALLIPSMTGATYSRQTGGHICLQDSLEGICIPINTFISSKGKHTSLADRLCNYFLSGSKQIDEEVADFLDSLLSESSTTKCVSVDRARLSASHEAWVHVVVSRENNYSFLANTDFRAILTWPNSD